MNKSRLVVVTLILALLLSTFGSMVTAQEGEAVELRILWYNDGVEGEVLRDLLDRFEEQNPDITVTIDTVAFADIHNTLQTALEGGDAPDMARVADVARFREYYLDMTPYLSEGQADYWNENFPAAVLNSMRTGADDTGIYGFPNQFTVTGPYVNLTLFEQAGVDVPGADATWEEWVAAAEEVASVTGVPYAVAIDRSGHRFWGPSLSMGATYINEDGSMTVDSEGFRAAAEMILDWHAREITPVGVWVGSGDQYASARDEFVNGQLVFYMSGSWQIGGFANDIGDSFEWAAVPNPSGVAGSTGIPGGTLFTALNTSEHPEEVARVMEFLASEENLGEFSARSLFIPGHLGLGETGVDYASYTDSQATIDALNIFVSEIPKLSDEAYGLQYSPIGFVLNTNIRDRLTQVIVGELTLDEAIERIQQAVDEAYAGQQ